MEIIIQKNTWQPTDDEIRKKEKDIFGKREVLCCPISEDFIQFERPFVELDDVNHFVADGRYLNMEDIAKIVNDGLRTCKDEEQFKKTIRGFRSNVREFLLTSFRAFTKNQNDIIKVET